MLSWNNNTVSVCLSVIRGCLWSASQPPPPASLLPQPPTKRRKRKGWSGCSVAHLFQTFLYCKGSLTRSACFHILLAADRSCRCIFGPSCIPVMGMTFFIKQGRRTPPWDLLGLRGLYMMNLIGIDREESDLEACRKVRCCDTAGLQE